MKRYKHTLFLILRIGIGIGLITYLIFSDSIKWSSLIGLSDAWALTISAFVLYLLAIFTTAWRLCFLLKPFGLHLTIFSSIKLTLIGTFFNMCLPGSTGGDIVKIYYATLHNHGRRTEVATILVFDRVMGMLSMLVLPVLIALMFPQFIEGFGALRSLLWISAITAIISFIVVFTGITYNLKENIFFSRVLKKIPFGSHIEEMLDTIRAYRHEKWCLIIALAQSLFAQLMTVGIMLLILKATNPAGFIWEASILISLGFLANTVPITPGGVGVGEVAFNKLFVLVGIESGVETILGWRLLTLIISFIGLFFYLQGRRRFVHHDAHLKPVEDIHCNAKSK